MSCLILIDETSQVNPGDTFVNPSDICGKIRNRIY